MFHFPHLILKMNFLIDSLPEVYIKKGLLHRCSYNIFAAEWYAKAADMTKGPKLKGYALWTAGTIIKARRPKIADIYFKKLFRVAPELTVRNWFKQMNLPDKLVKFYRCREF